MKLLQINAVYKTRSTGRSMWELDQYFTEKAHQVCAAFSVGAVEDPQTEYLIGDHLGQKSHAFLSRLTGLQGYFSRYSTKKLLRFMDAYQPDAVILRNLHANYIHLPKLLKYLAKKDIPTVAVLHDCWFYTGKCCHYTVAGCDRWQERCGNCPAKKKYNKSWLFDRSSKMLADKIKYFRAIPRLGVVAVSDWLLKEAKKAPVFQNAVVMERIYNWIDTEKFAPQDTSALRQELGLTDKSVVLSVASGWNREKGLDAVLDLAKRLQPQQRLLLVGNIPDETQLPEQVIHLPATDSVEQLVALYSLADVFFQPSLEETFGKVSAEALACGTPVVCFNSTANPELVGPGCGAVAEPGNVEEAFREIQAILRDGKHSYTANCRQFAKDQFNMQKNADHYLTLITRLSET